MYNNGTNHFDLTTGAFSQYAQGLINNRVQSGGYNFHPVTGAPSLAQNPYSFVQTFQYGDTPTRTDPTPQSVLPSVPGILFNSTPTTTATQAAAPVVSTAGAQRPEQWVENPGLYGQSANVYSKYGFNDAARNVAGLANWNSTWNVGGPQVRAFAANPYGYDSSGSTMMIGPDGKPIYADEVQKIDAALKALADQRAAEMAAAPPAYTPYFNADMPNRPWVVPM